MYPVMLDVRGRDVLVVGGGPVGTQKARGLVAAGAAVTVVAPTTTAELDALTDAVVEHREYVTADLDGRWLVFAATGDPVLQQRIHDEATERRIWVNCADEPERCTFTLPAIHRQGPVVVSVSTGGASPALAGWLRTRLAAALPRDLDALVEELRARRAAMKATGTSTESTSWTPVIESILVDLEARRAESPLR